MRCFQVEESLMAYIDGRLPSATTAKVGAHLDVCPRCRKRYADEVELTAAFQADSAGLTAEGMALRVLDAIEQAEAPQSPASQRPPRGEATWVVLAIAAVFAGLALGSWWLPASSSAGSIAAGSWLGRTQIFAQTVTQSLVGMVARTAAAMRDAWSAAQPDLGSALGAHFTTIVAITALAALSCAVLVGKWRAESMKEGRR